MLDDGWLKVCMKDVKSGNNFWRISWYCSKFYYSCFSSLVHRSIPLYYVQSITTTTLHLSNWYVKFLIQTVWIGSESWISTYGWDLMIVVKSEWNGEGRCGITDYGSFGNGRHISADVFEWCVRMNIYEEVSYLLCTTITNCKCLFSLQLQVH